MVRRFNKAGYGYTGHQLEQEVFGEVREILKKEQSYMPYPQAMEIVKRHQPGEDPTDPEARFANDLHATLFASLGIKPEELRFYTAVGSSLDRNHGIDAFFEVGEEEDFATVTMDVTTNEMKSESAKADVTFHMPHDGLDPKLDKEEYFKKLEEVAERIAILIRNPKENKEASA